ncbi:arginase family protein [Plantactinospora siamensis]|uniref:Arginase family protein n=1 Tax=Plantactinospora siamensis TaxID=555372 RepID=A0ABV6NRQ3_9ACTN
MPLPLVVPYHLDEHLPDLDLLLPPGAAAETVTVELPEGDPWDRMARLHDRVADLVADRVRGNAVPAVLSGDCMVALGVLAGLQRAGVQPALVWFDAHGDLQTLETSASGYLGGIPLRILTGYRPELSADRLGLRPLATDRVVLVDGRDLDPPEETYLATAGIHRSTVPGLTATTLPPGPLMLHLDADVIDPGELPEPRYPAPRGPSAAEVLAAVRRVFDTGRVVAYDLGCTWKPRREVPSATRARLLDTLLLTSCTW